MQEEARLVPHVQRAARILIKVILGLLLFVLLVFLLLLTPPVQRFATNQVENYLEKKLDTRVEIGSISFGLPRKLHLENVYIEDRSKDTLLSGGSIRAELEFFALLNNEVRIRSIDFDNITAKIRREGKDTVFNFQFIVDAFTPARSIDTSSSTPMVLEADRFSINNSRILYNDVITGNEMLAVIRHLSAETDTIDTYGMHYDVPLVKAEGMMVRFYQRTPLATAEPASVDIAEAARPSAMKLKIGRVLLKDVDFEYGNDVSAFYTVLDIGNLDFVPRTIDLNERLLHFDQLVIDNTNSAIRLGKKEAARQLEKEVEKEIEVQKQQGWVIRADNIALNNNVIQFDNDNHPKTGYGMDYSHLRGDSLTLHVRDFVMNMDTIGGVIAKGFFKEKSGFRLDALEAEVLYAQNQAFLKNLYLKTPGTELKRQAVLEYASYDALVKNFEKTVFDLELVNSHIQVKDILTFAPQLRTHAAFKKPYDIWQLNVVGSGTMDRLHFDELQFEGLSNTSIDASGTLSGLSNPNAAGGNFVIRRLRTSQTDLSIFTGQRLSTPDVRLPETFEAKGTLSGNMANMAANLNIYTADGSVAVNGRFRQLMSPTKASYNTRLVTRGLRLDKILPAAGIGSLSANLQVAGSGLTPQTFNARVNGKIHSVGYNRYNYRNIAVNGTVKQSAFDIKADIRDPNIDLTGTFTGSMGATSSFRVNAQVDSLKTLPLHFTTEPLVFRGKVDADIRSLNKDYLDGEVLVTDALMITKGERLPIDTMTLVSGREGGEQFIRLNSEIANAEMRGQYRFSELGSIILHNIDPYFSVASPGQLSRVSPYDITFIADIQNSPFLSVFFPGMKVVQPIHAEGSLATGRGLQADVNTAALEVGTNKISDLSLHITTTPQGLQLTGNIGHLVSGTSYDIYNADITATALNDVIDFKLGIDDKAAKDKYNIAGIFRQTSPGVYSLKLKPDGLMLNYDMWTVSADNEIIIRPESIGANNFTLTSGNQQMTLQSPAGSTGPLNANFRNFKLGTITGFIKADSALVDGTMNGNVNFVNLMKQPLFTADLVISDFSMRHDTLGNLDVKVNNPSANNYIANIRLTGRGNDVAVTGTLKPQGTDVAMDLDLVVNALQLSTLEGAMAGAINNARGSVDGSVKIKGTLAQPSILGELDFNDATFNTTILGSTFRIDNETLKVTEKGFMFDNFMIRDSINNTLVLNGFVQTNNFINYYFDLDVDADNFQIMNTQKTQGAMYYGSMVISSDLHFAGTEKNPIVDGGLTINDRTDFTLVIPQRQAGVSHREGVVEFVDMEHPEDAKLFRAYDTVFNYANLIGFDVAVNAEIKKEAIFNLVIDEANGDFINVQGEALLTAGVDPSGKVTLTGSYVLEEGSYELSFNFIRRKFNIQQGSKIVWLGEPTGATLDVTAIYIANTAPIDLVQQQLSASAASLRNSYFLQKLPFEVHLKVTGELLRPDIGFDIILPPERNYNVDKSVVQLVDARLAQIRQEPSELNKQVFALMLLNRFVGENPFETSSDGFNLSSYARQSVSKLMTEQLNRLASGLVHGVDINFDVVSTADYTTGERRNRTDLNVSLSKQLLSDRLTVTIGTNMLLEGHQPVNSGGASSLLGDVSVNYKLSKDGRYMLRAYQKNEYEGVVEGYIIETGLGFSINVDYDHFRELFGKKKPIEGIDDKQKELTDAGANK